MKKLMALILSLMFIFAVLVGCSSNDANSKSNSTITHISFSPDVATNTIAILENKMLYQSLETGASTFYIFDLQENQTVEIGTIADYVMDSGSAVTIGNSVYEYITTEDENGQPQNELYRINCSDCKMERMLIDKECAPLISLYRVPAGLLALKATNSKTYFDLFDESTQSSNVVLEAPKGEVFVTATVSDETLFVFAYAEDAGGGYDYFIRKYTVDGYNEIGIISLDNIEEFITEARIAEIDILGGYLFLNNYSNVGLISSINEDGSVSACHEISNIARLPLGAENQNELFYVRQSNTYYVFDTVSGGLQQMVLPVDNGYLIRSMFADGENVVVKMKTQNERKLSKYKEEIYIFEYTDLITQRQ